MPLTLTILSHEGHSFPDSEPVVIGGAGTIGRTGGNVLVLNSPEISRIHAIITEEVGLFFIKNEGKNGTFLNGYPLGVNSEPNPLANGDKLRIGEYEILVSITSTHDSKNDFAENKIDMDDIFSAMQAPLNPIHNLTNPFDIFSESDADSELDISKFFKIDAVTQKNQHSELVENFEFDKPEVRQMEVNSNNQNNDDLLRVFLKGAGLEPNKIELGETAEKTMLHIGQMFRELINGTAGLLRSRAEFKNLSRIDATTIRIDGNNPLKFSPATDFLLKQLVENKEKGFIGSVNAIEQAFEDIENHQVAMQAGIQASLTNLLETFNPRVVEKQFEHGFVLQKKAKCWDKYREIYQDTVDTAVEDFYGEAFVEGYEEQIKASKRRK